MITLARPTEIVNDRLILSSEAASYINKLATASQLEV
jgi:hypothetical protein